jgi:hypothetical protein
MKILATEKELKSVPKDKTESILKQEAFKVWELKEKDVIREIYFNEKHCAVLILECTNQEIAKTILSELPLVQEGYIEFEIMELKPYTGLRRLF